jgi:dTDP-4-amino-4,6-dideoxygalactose transaminase
MSPLMAAVGIAQLGRVDGYIARRRAAGAILDDMLWEVPGITPQKKASPDDRSGYYQHAYLYDEDHFGVPVATFVEACLAEGARVGGPYVGGKGLYRYPIFSEEQTYGRSRYPFVDEQGNRRVDYNALHLPVLEDELPRTLSVGGHSNYTDEDARDIANAIIKVAGYYSGHK